MLRRTRRAETHRGEVSLLSPVGFHVCSYKHHIGFFLTRAYTAHIATEPMLEQPDGETALGRRAARPDRSLACGFAGGSSKSRQTSSRGRYTRALRQTKQRDETNLWNRAMQPASSEPKANLYPAAAIWRQERAWPPLWLAQRQHLPQSVSVNYDYLISQLSQFLSCAL